MPESVTRAELEKLIPANYRKNIFKAIDKLFPESEREKTENALIQLHDKTVEAKQNLDSTFFALTRVLEIGKLSAPELINQAIQLGVKVAEAKQDPYNTFSWFARVLDIGKFSTPELISQAIQLGVKAVEAKQDPSYTFSGFADVLKTGKLNTPEQINQIGNAIIELQTAEAAEHSDGTFSNLNKILKTGKLKTLNQINQIISLGIQIAKINQHPDNTYYYFALVLKTRKRISPEQINQAIQLGIKTAEAKQDPQYMFSALNLLLGNRPISIDQAIQLGIKTAEAKQDPQYTFAALNLLLLYRSLSMAQINQTGNALIQLQTTITEAKQNPHYPFNALGSILTNHSFSSEQINQTIQLGIKTAETKQNPYYTFDALNSIFENTNFRQVKVGFLIGLFEKNLKPQIPIPMLSSSLNSQPEAYRSKAAQELSLKFLEQGIVPTPALIDSAKNQDQTQFLKSARETLQDFEVREPDFSRKLDREIFFSYLKNEDLTYKDYLATIQKIRVNPFWEKKAALFPTLKITARLAESFYPKLVKEKTAKLRELLAQKNAESLQQKALEQLGVKPSKEESLEETALKLQISHDNGEIKADELLHDLHEQIALQKDQQLHDRVNNQDAEESLPALVELYSDRLRDAKIKTLTYLLRLKNLVEKHAQILANQGVKAKLKPDFDFLAQYYEKHAKAKELHASLQTQYQERLAEIKKENQEKVSQAQGKQEQEEIISQTAEKISGLKAEFQPKLQELKEIQETSNQKTFQQLLNELHSSNDFTKKARQNVEALYKKTTTTQSGKQTTLTLDFKPSVRDAFTGWFSNDCTKGIPLLFSKPGAHNVKVFQGKKHVGNIYLLEGQSGDRKILHIDAIQTPIKVDMPHFTKELVETLWRQAQKHGFKALTANENLELVSNHESVRQGFQKNYANSLPTKIVFRGFNGFQSSNVSHLILRR